MTKFSHDGIGSKMTNPFDKIADVFEGRRIDKDHGVQLSPDNLKKQAEEEAFRKLHRQITEQAEREARFMENVPPEIREAYEFIKAYKGKPGEKNYMTRVNAFLHKDVPVEVREAQEKIDAYLQAEPARLKAYFGVDIG